MSVPIAYVTIILIWSTTPLAIQWSALGAGFAFAVMARMVIGAALALVLVAVWRVGLPLHRRALLSYLAGGLGTFGAMICTYWGAQYIHSGLVSVLFGLTPLITGVLAVFWLDEPALRPGRLIGILLGILGLALIFAGSRDMPNAAHAATGIGALLLAVIVYSTSLVWIKRIGDDSPPLATTAGTLLVSLPLFTATWLGMDGSIPMELPAKAAAAIAYLGVFGSVLGFALYYYVIKHLDAGKVALITLITPVFALLLGHAINGEAVAPRVWAGAGLISLGLAIHYGRESWRQFARA